jgi:hypothetical protein
VLNSEDIKNINKSPIQIRNPTGQEELEGLNSKIEEVLDNVGMTIQEKLKETNSGSLSCLTSSGLRIRIRMFLGLLDPDPVVRGTDPDPSILKHK